MQRMVTLIGLEKVKPLHVGTPPAPLGSPLSKNPFWIVRDVHFHAFARLPTSRGTEIKSAKFSCFGQQWSVAVYPGGGFRSREGYVSFYLCNESPESIETHFKILMKHPTDQAQMAFGCGTTSSLPMKTFGASGSETSCWGTMIERQTVLTYLNNGALTLEIHLRASKQAEPTTSFVPSNSMRDNILKGFNSEEKSDVKFEVGGETETTASNRRKRAKSTATIFYASHWILDLNAPALADMCRPGAEAAVPIRGVEPKVFKMVLYFCYGGNVSKEELVANTKAIIEAADRFEIVNLKLQAEFFLTEHTEIAVENVLDNLLYANSKNLALFQEKIMDFVAGNVETIVGNISFDDIPGNLMTDLLTAVARGNISTGDEVPGDHLKFMRVAELRKRLHDRGLCIDGSRETMIALLRENSNSAIGEVDADQS